MAKKVELDRARIISLLRTHPEGMTLAGIRKALSEQPIAYRTSQRRISDLLSSRFIMAQGKARARTFRPVMSAPESYETPTYPTTPQPPPGPQPEGDVELSAEALEQFQLVSQKGHLRGLSQYRQELLESYVPNQTQYIDDGTLARLMDLGKRRSHLVTETSELKRMYDRFLVDLSWNSARLDGYSYSQVEAERILQVGEVPPDTDILGAQIFANHREGLDFLRSLGATAKADRFTTLNLHSVLSDNLSADPTEGGRLRTGPVHIPGSSFLPLEEDELIEEEFGLVLAKASQISHPIEKAFFLVLHLHYLQPFASANNLTARLLCNIPLLTEGLFPISFAGIPASLFQAALNAVYELNEFELLKEVFAWSYKKSVEHLSLPRTTSAQPNIFRLKYRESIRAFIREVVRLKFEVKDVPSIILPWMRDRIPEIDQDTFCKTVAIEIQSIHEGNCARYQLNPREYYEWKAASQTWVSQV